MKIVVIGGSGLIGSKLVTRLREQGHETLAASLDSGVNTLTGEGLAGAIEGASVVADVSNAPSFEDAAVLTFFETSTRHLLAAESAAGVEHHVALSVVGTERLSDSGYFRAKIAQEKLIEDSTSTNSYGARCASATTPARSSPTPTRPTSAPNCANAPLSPPPAPASPRLASAIG